MLPRALFSEETYFSLYSVGCRCTSTFNYSSLFTMYLIINSLIYKELLHFVCSKSVCTFVSHHQDSGSLWWKFTGFFSCFCFITIWYICSLHFSNCTRFAHVSCLLDEFYLYFQRIILWRFLSCQRSMDCAPKVLDVIHEPSFFYYFVDFVLSVLQQRNFWEQMIKDSSSLGDQWSY